MINDLNFAVKFPLASVIVKAGITTPKVFSVAKTTTIAALGRPFTLTCPERFDVSPATIMVGTAIMVILAFFRFVPFIELIPQHLH
ncbi:hypothetical protein QIH01_23020 [Brevibacillus brevis]|uniref:hypothetical protein n=1 Tax=Brevibacillus brevis TaxID=1393 RepID=UPI0012FCF0D4|nr:hypothetical protein [Brevibacillus brevis]WGV58326.1 hypothetical protein QIH01_23020 [Brevibacillus brevis]